MIYKQNLNFLKKYELRTNQRGVSLVELILVVMAIAFLALMIANLPSSISSINKSRNMSLARDIASKKIEYFREQEFSTLLNETNSFMDDSLLKLPLGQASYEITNCPESVCSEDVSSKIKQVKVFVLWRESGEEKKVELTTLLGEEGLGQ